MSNNNNNNENYNEELVDNSNNNNNNSITTDVTYSINSSNYNLYEYLCQNHPNCKISFLEIFRVDNFKKTNRFKILEILNENGFIRKDDNGEYIFTKIQVKKEN
ncbi:hypothetical protein ACTFIZ_003588 [Dictyostelium cf. discoideum]